MEETVFIFIKSKATKGDLLHFNYEITKWWLKGGGGVKF